MVMGMVFICCVLASMDMAMICGCISWSFFILNRLFSTLAWRNSLLKSLWICWFLAILIGSVIRLLTMVLTVIMIRPAIISVRTGYCPSKAMYLNTKSRAWPIWALNIMTTIMMTRTSIMPIIVLDDIGGAWFWTCCMLCGLPGLGTRSLSVSEESAHHRVHLHHLLATHGLVEVDDDSHAQQHSRTARVTRGSDHVGSCGQGTDHRS